MKTTVHNVGCTSKQYSNYVEIMFTHTVIYKKSICRCQYMAF